MNRGRHRWYRSLAALGSIGASPSDTDEAGLQKSLLVASTLMMASLAVLWGALYLAYEEWLAGAIPLSYAVASFASGRGALSDALCQTSPPTGSVGPVEPGLE